MPQALSSHAPFTITTPVASITQLQRNNSRTWLPDALHGVLDVSSIHIRRAPLFFLRDRIYRNEKYRRFRLISMDGDRCCNCDSIEHSLRWCPAPFKNTSSPLTSNLERTILTDLCSIHGNYACASCVSVVLSVTTKLMADGTPPEVPVSATLTKNITWRIQVTMQGQTRCQPYRSSYATWATDTNRPELYCSSGSSRHEIWAYIHRLYEPGHLPARRAPGPAYANSVTVRKQCCPIRSTVYKATPRMC